MRLGIDLDGVVANFTKGWMTFYNRDFGADLEVEDSRAWNDLVELTHFNNIGEFWDWASDVDGHSVFWHLETFPGSVEALHELSQDGHEIVIITTKPRFAIEDTHSWLESNDIPRDEVHILGKKWTIDCEIYLDDGPYVLPGLLKHRPDRTVCRYIRPWNEAIPPAIDVRNFDDFRNVVRETSARLP